ncbi:Rubrerythrin [Caminicella sporogenes DSM 14501]|uniref:Rubrerythrin n=1 Tax=Caminicella sporogenes DSM 14501 TaxID=1121266 RepID=A0A1M6NWA5_9FIRM|nr:spore coat protein [Caminicella sporogenes]RKD21622.1 coat protein F [Caminicella sporogenes]WIF94096.1 spore coat protein [Caminicella sporogenes]SHJ99985.1 Rubrerythrin [Caminicella sporogenes DSM 14501]
MQISQKERMLLEEQRNQEEICVKKYQNYANQAQDPQLKQLFNKIATEEQHHYDIINQILNGQQPNLSHAQINQQVMFQQAQVQQMNSENVMSNQKDKVLCNDLLSTEKYVSGTYDTVIFECVNPTIRQALQHIQQDEQQHGKELFDYMNSHGMYNVK